MEALINSLGLGPHGQGRSMPLTTPDLHLLLDRMQVRTEETKDRVFGTIRAHHQDFLELVQHADVAAESVEKLHSQVQEVLDEKAFETGAISFDSQLWKLSAEFKSMRAELGVKRTALAAVKSVLALRDELLAGKELFLRGQLVEGVSKVVGVDQTLERDYKGSSLIMLRLLRKLGSDVFSEVEASLASLFSQAVEVNLLEGTLAVRMVSFAETHVNLAMISEAMEVLGILDETLTRFTDVLFKLLTLLISEPLLVITLEEIKNDVAVFRFTKQEASQRQQELLVEEVYERVLSFLKFVQKFVASSREAWMLKLSKRIWPRLADMIIQTHLRKAVPKDHREFGEFEKIQTLTSEFENSLHTHNLIPVNEQGEKLSSFTSDVEVYFSENKRKTLLAKARQVIIEFDYAHLLKSIARGEDQLLIKGENYVVSYLSKQLLSLVHETLKDACSSTSRIAIELYKAARDVIFLFRAIFLVQHDKTALQAAPIFYSDCLYIARELAHISEQYNSSLPLELQQSCTLMDLVPLFKSMSTRMLSEQFQFVNSQLRQALDECNEFRATDERVHREATQSSLQQVVSILQTVHVTWHEFLPKTIESRGLMRLTDPIIQRILDEVLSIQDFAAEETVQLHNLLEELMQGIRPVLTCLEECYGRPLERILPAWRKLECLSELLEMSLRPITKAWESGSLSSAGFSAAEVHNLIRAIFTDTSLRAECLQRIL